MFRCILRFARDKNASTAIEYALIGGLVSIAILVGVIALGGELSTVYAAMAGSVPN